MKKIILFGLILISLSILGASCEQTKIVKEYVCQDGSTFSDVSLCPDYKLNKYDLQEKCYFNYTYNWLEFCKSPACISIGGLEKGDLEKMGVNVVRQRDIEEEGDYLNWDADCLKALGLWEDFVDQKIHTECILLSGIKYDKERDVMIFDCECLIADRQETAKRLGWKPLG